MREAVSNLSVKPDLILVDAVKIDFDCETRAIIKGDATSYSIASASIIAKVSRDRLMEEYDEKYPGYGFKKHKGYGTAEHIKAIKELGPCPVHRRSFIGNFVNE
jgi:ribonuclease HII